MHEVKSVDINGERYEATVPDTLDLADRARLAINGLGGSSDIEFPHHHYFYIRYRARPPYMYHWGANDTSCTPKFAESFPMMRMMCDSDQYLDLERAQMQGLVENISPDDGLYYCVADPEKRPWHMCGDHHYATGQQEDFAPVTTQARMTRAMLAWSQRDGDPAWKDLTRKLLLGLKKILIEKDDYVYHPDAGVASDFCYPRSGWRHTHEPGGDQEGGEGSVTGYHGHQLYGIAQWLEVVGEGDELLELGRKLKNFIMKPRFWGGYVEPLQVCGSQLGHCNYHLHARAPSHGRRLPATAQTAQGRSRVTVQQEPADLEGTPAGHYRTDKAPLGSQKACQPGR